MNHPLPITHYSLRFTPYVLLLTFLLSACASPDAGPRPPEILYGQDVCDECGMIIGEAKYAAATITLDGQAHKFDDAGEMLVYHMEHPEEQVKAWFVHDYPSEAWIRAETAFYVLSPQIASPMGHGIAAFEQRSAAEAFARDRDQAQVLNFDELRVAVHLTAHGAQPNLDSRRQPQ